ncbi:MAG: pdxJ [Fibrobacteria bacterium]|jgi:pyridoxine 5-phosphate synthase|nr:pdxJ [Fibrobacteria bacterium]
MPKLGVNIDHVATLRQARRELRPDPVEAAALCERAGADGITVHLREDRRHIQEHDVVTLRRTVTTHLNLEMAATPAMIDFALNLRPDMATLVPERREELTTEGGLDAAARLAEISGAVLALQGRGIPVSLFIEPEMSQVEAALKSGAAFVEFHTGAYARAFHAGAPDAEFARIATAAVYSRRQGLQVNMGHGLDYDNVRPIAELEGVWELNIGHSIMARAILVGMERAVGDMKALVTV